MIIKLRPIKFSKVWGGDNLSKMYKLPKSNIGEVWGLSAHKFKSSIIVDGPHKDMNLRELFINYKKYFGYYPGDEFPLLIKLIDAKEDLSIQVHPNDQYALIHEKTFGKDECWYIIDADKDSKIQIGHSAKNKNEMKNAILNNTLVNILSYHKISANDFYYIPSGKVHAICKNTTILEVSQSSDVTYRLYDYNRLDDGKLRELHVDKALDVISFPDTEIEKADSNKYFTFKVFEVTNQMILSHKYADYLYIIEGNGFVDDEKISKGDFFIVSSNCEYLLQGKIKLALIRITF